MPDWLLRLFEGWPMIRANLPTFALVIIAIVLGVWWLVNWSYSSVVSSKTAQIEIQDRQLADYKAKLEGATPDQAKARIDALEARLSELEPRRLNGAQLGGLIERLRQTNVYAVTITSEMGGDSQQYGADFANAFRQAGWRIGEGAVMGIGNRPPTGIAIQYLDLNKPPEEATIIINALRAAAIQFDIQQGIAHQANVQLLICTHIVR